jgi:imidazolonepropionase-like amidohydrolase
MVHANGELPVRIALEAGCRSVEHGFFMGPDNLRRMAEKGICWIPTAVTMKAMAGCLEASARGCGGIRGQGKTALEGRPAQVARQTLDHQLEQISMARQYGVSIAVGTDAGSMGVDHGAAVMEEMKLLMEAGLSLEESVRCATYQGARLLGLDGLGLIAAGRRAVFVATKGDPSGLPESLNDPVFRSF